MSCHWLVAKMGFQSPLLSFWAQIHFLLFKCSSFFILLLVPVLKADWQISTLIVLIYSKQCWLFSFYITPLLYHPWQTVSVYISLEDFSQVTLLHQYMTTNNCMSESLNHLLIWFIQELNILSRFLNNLFIQFIQNTDSFRNSFRSRWIIHSND